MSTETEQNKAIILMCLHEYSKTSPQMAIEAYGLHSKTGLSAEEINEAVQLLREEGLVWVYDGEPKEPYSFERAKITTKGEYVFLNGKVNSEPNPKREKNNALMKWYFGTLEEEKRAEEKKKAEAMFDQILTHSVIKQVSKNHFMNGEYRSAVLDAMIQLEEMIKIKAKLPKDDRGNELFGCSLMYTVFNSNIPILKWSKLERQNEKDELSGYSHIFAGAVQGIRDPKAHMIFEQRPLRALQLLTLASLLADLVEVSEYVDYNKQHG
jgi:uncharacterized protein (TIGR02391 family)